MFRIILRKHIDFFPVSKYCFAILYKKWLRVFYHGTVFNTNHEQYILPEVSRYSTFEPSITSVPSLEQAHFFKSICLDRYRSISKAILIRWKKQLFFSPLPSLSIYSITAPAWASFWLSHFKALGRLWERLCMCWFICSFPLKPKKIRDRKYWVTAFIKWSIS